MKKLIWFYINLLLMVSVVWGQTAKNITNVATTSAPFLSIEVGARAIAMGGAFVATSDDATSLYWNPAGIGLLDQNEVSFHHTEWLAETNFDYAGIVIPLGLSGTVGLSFTSLTMSDMEVRTVFNPEGTGELFTANDMAIGVSYAKNLTDRFTIGFTGKYIHQKLWHMTASSFAFDIGTLFTTQLNGMRIGMSISNFGSKMQLVGKDTQVNYDVDEAKQGNNDKILAHLDTDKWSLPLTFRVGVAMEVLQTEFNYLTIAVDAIHPNDNTECLNVGAEYVIKNRFFFRGGYKALFQQDSEEGLTLGAGLAHNLTRYVRIKIDYAYADFGLLEYVQRFSLALEF